MRLAFSRLSSIVLLGALAGSAGCGGIGGVEPFAGAWGNPAGLNNGVTK
jgi:hypothetical protein